MIEMVKKLSKEEWSEVANDAHLAVFGKSLPENLQRYDFALMSVGRDNKPMSYVTCRELDSESVYWQFGGSFPGTKGSIKSVVSMEEFIRFCKTQYKRVSFLVENDNKAMLKMAMLWNFKIVGVRNYKDSILLEHLLEF